MRFKDRTDAGIKLAQLLAPTYARVEGVVYALPRGGVVLGIEIARRLHMPLDLVIARKIGHPYNPEYAIAAVTERGEPVVNAEEVAPLPRDWFQTQVKLQREEARRRREVYLDGRAPLSCRGQTAIVVDDGIATGLTMEAAIRELKHAHPARLVLAVPVAPADTGKRFRAEVDDLVAVDLPEYYLGGVGAYYQHFPQVTDEEVVALLREAGAGVRQPAHE